MEDRRTSPTVLIVDDHQGLISLIQRCLSREGFQTAVAHSGHDALHWLSHHQADLMLLDLQLADMTGEALIQRLEHQALGLPFIVITGQGDARLAVKMMKHGARDYFLKDSTLIELLPSIVTQTLDQIHQENRLARTEETLREERDRLAITLGAIVEGVFITDSLGQVNYMNRRAEELSGWDHTAAMGCPIDEVVRFFDSTWTKKPSHPVKQVLQDGIALFPHEPIDLLSRKNGSRPVTYSVAPLPGSNGGSLGAVLILQDMTEKLKLDQERLKVSKLNSLGVLAGGIAHDFNNLLASILGNVSLTKTWLNPRDRLYTHLSEAENSSLRAKTLTHQLLTFAKGGSPVKKLFSLPEVVSESSTFALSGSSTRCECLLSDELWLIEADENQVSQVIHNLALNAQQAMPTGGTLIIKGENTTLSESQAKQYMLPQGGHYVRLQFSDTGPGIPQKALPQIFDPYFSTKPTHSGLGLSTAYSIIKSHQGHIAVESFPQQGTTVTILLPARPEAARSQHSPIVKNGEGRILVMDDEASIRLMLGEMLRHLGYDVTCASEGQEALKLYQDAFHTHQRFHAVILDLTVPGGLGGKETIDHLRQFDPQVKAIVSSGYSNDPILSCFSSFGFQGVVAKPFRLTELSHVLHQVNA